MEKSSADQSYKISDADWEQIETLLTPDTSEACRTDMDARKAMEAILYVLHTDFKWGELPPDLGAPDAVRECFEEWRKAGVFERMWKAGFLSYDELREFFWHGRKRPMP